MVPRTPEPSFPRSHGSRLKAGMTVGHKRSVRAEP
ncbi:hypothetical protein EV292_105231 [Sphingomonas sp. BK235]|nr:hypothetical protein EV292_105231 [Sphingomonas sp. BK235]